MFFLISAKKLITMRPIALITGSTSGIGEATALVMAKNNFDVIITGRRKEKLIALEKRIKSESKSQVLSLNFDVQSLPETENAINGLPEKWKNIDVLINNAGLAAGMAPIQDGDINDWERMIDTNIKGLLYISRFISPLMVKRNSGHIINISSIAGKETYLNGNVYCATKHAVQSLTAGMRMDLLKHGIKVSSICPGAVDTEFSEVRFHGDKNKAKEVYKGFTPLFAQDIADTILFAVTRPKHVNLDDILIMPTAQAFSREIHRKEVD
jgi:NADP-dependent 3-hydroxy acid dehydrogenase YdfG